MLKNIRIAVTLIIFFTLVYGFAYSGLITQVANAAFKDKAQGSLITKDGKIVGSELIGQNFSAPGYFWGRLSATSDRAYNAASSGGSNYSYNNPELEKAAKARIDALEAAGGKKPVPSDLVTASGSGLDPHISVAAAEYQVARVAAARKISEQEVAELVKKHTEQRQLGIFGEPRVNVLKLNLALDNIGK